MNDETLLGDRLGTLPQADHGWAAGLWLVAEVAKTFGSLFRQQQTWRQHETLREFRYAMIKRQHSKPFVFSGP